MTTNLDRVAEAIMKSIVMMDERLALDIARNLHAAGRLAPDLPEPIINADDGNYEWHSDEYTVDVDRGMVGLWTPDGTHWGQTPNQARNLALALLAAADYAEREEVTDE